MKINQEPGRLTQFAPLSQQQQGATLIVALVMLLLISLLAVGGMQGSILQERMASNAHDGAISFQASEAALRQAEADLLVPLSAARTTASGTSLLPTPWNWDGAAPAGTGDAGGNVSAQPVFHQAHLADVPSSAETPPLIFERFAVTSRGQGGSEQAVTVLQSTILLPP